MGSVVFFFRYHTQSASGANSDASWLHAELQTDIAAIALLHFPLGVEGRGSEGTCHRTTVAADTVGIVVDGQTGSGILTEALHRASCDARSIIAMHAGNTIVMESGLSVLLLCFEYSTEGSTSCFWVKIILIHTGNRAGSAGTAFGGIKIQDHLIHAVILSCRRSSGWNGERGTLSRDPDDQRVRDC